jgi:hypothetical protein
MRQSETVDGNRVKKISGVFRDENGVDEFALIRSVLSADRKARLGDSSDYYEAAPTSRSPNYV